MEIQYLVHVRVPEPIDTDLLTMIREHAETKDQTVEAQVRRWIGTDISACEIDLADALPDGWAVSIEEVRS